MVEIASADHRGVLLDSPPEGSVHHLVHVMHWGVTEFQQEGATAGIALIVLVCAGAVFVAASATTRSALVSAPERRGLALWVALARVMALLASFAVLAYQVRLRGWLTSLDGPTLSWMVIHRSAWLTGPAIAITDAGGPLGTVVLAVVIGVVLAWRARSWIPAIVLICTVGGAAVACSVAKMLVARQRPPVITQVLLETDHSFPSGHTTGAMALFAMTAVLLGAGRPAWSRWVLAVVAGALTTLVAVTRLYLGVHWLTDVIGGVLLGGAAVLVGSVVYVALTNRTERIAGRDQEATDRGMVGHVAADDATEEIVHLVA